MADVDQSLLGTFQKHIEDMRNLSLCKICIKPFYEPFILGCGHTYCYSCLASWFGGAQGRKKNKNCPDCRAEVTVQPSPNYLLRDLVHMFIGRAELLPEDETVQEHLTGKDEEAVLLAADRAGPGLFKGVFLRRQHPVIRWGHGLLDHEDNVMRCPECHWELEDGECLQCGFREFEAGDDSETDSDDDSLDLHTIDTEFDSDGLPIFSEYDGPEVHGPFPGLMNYYGSISDAEDYDEDEDDDGFIDDEVDEVDEDDDRGSEATMTDRRRTTIGPRDPPFHRLPFGDDNGEDDTATQATSYDGQSDANTNYDEQTESSDQDFGLVDPSRHQRRFPRVVISDDDDDDDESDQEQEEVSGEFEANSEQGDHTETSQDDNDESSESTEQDETENGESDSEESDSTAIRAPQSIARRRLHLQNMRSRRESPSYDSHGQSNRGQHQQSHVRQRSNQPTSNRMPYGARRFNRANASPGWRRGIRGF